MMAFLEIGGRGEPVHFIGGGAVIDAELAGLAWNVDFLVGSSVCFQKDRFLTAAPVLRCYRPCSATTSRPTTTSFLWILLSRSRRTNPSVLTLAVSWFAKEDNLYFAAKESIEQEESRDTCQDDLINDPDQSLVAARNETDMMREV